MSAPEGAAQVGRHEAGAPEARVGDELLSVPSVPLGALVAARAADDKQGRDTVVLAMEELFGVVDAFVVTSGRNVRQVHTLVEEIEERVKRRCGRGPTSVEGLRDATWVLLDYGDFVVHVFLEETRSYYDLEHLWSSAPRVGWRERVAGAG
jgi:ribosome-associated protein